MRKIFVEGFGTIGVDDKATDDEISAHVEDYKATKGAPTPITLGPEGTNEQLRKMGSEMGPAEGLMIGGMKGAMSTADALGMGHLMGIEDKITGYRKALEETAAGTTPLPVRMGGGSVSVRPSTVGDIATGVGGATSLVRAGAKALPAAVSRWAVKNPVQASIAAGGTTGGVLTPGDVTDRAVGAGVGMAVPAVTMGAVKAGAGLIKNKNPFAETLLNLGVPVPWGRASSSKAIQETQKLGEKMTPWVDTQSKVIESTLREAGKRATPPGMPHLNILPGRGEYFQKLFGDKGQYDQAYDRLLSGRVIGTGPVLRQELTDIANNQPDKSIGKAVHRWLANQKYLEGDFITGRQWKDLQASLRTDIRSAYKSDKGANLGEALDKVDQALILARNRSVPKDVVDDLNATDEAYANGMILERAAGYKSAAMEDITPKNLLSATETAPRSIKTKGQERLGDLSIPLAKVTEESKLPWWVAHGSGLVAAPFTGGASILANAAIPPAVALSGKNAVMNKLMMGQYPKQQALADWLRRTAPAIGAAEGAALPILKD